MKTETKIQKLEEALLKGNALTPMMAWDLWGMAMNTFNMSIFRLKKRGFNIKSSFVTKDKNSYKIHWIEI